MKRFALLALLLTQIACVIQALPAANAVAKPPAPVHFERHNVDVRQEIHRQAERMHERFRGE